MGNNWEGLWKSRDGSLIQISRDDYGIGYILGKILKYNLLSVWNSDTGNHFDDPNLDLCTKKRDEEKWDD